MTRADGRADDELRPVTITRSWLDHAAGSVLVEFGRTRVLCAASAAEGAAPDYPAFAGIALEPQVFPDSPHHREWPSAVLRPGEEYRHVTTWRFLTA